MSSQLIETQGALFIGSMILDDTNPARELFADAAKLACSGEIAHMPQLPQLDSIREEKIYSMDPEATYHFPFLTTDREKGLVYELIVTEDSGAQDGVITPYEQTKAPEVERLFEEVNLFVGYVATNVDHTFDKEVHQSLDRIVELFPDFGWRPEGLEALVQELKTGSKNQVTVKLELSGPINTAESIKTRTGNGEVMDGKLVRLNSQMLDFHAGLVLARSFLWSQHVKDELANVGKNADIIFSFDEPIFDNLNLPTSVSENTAKHVYETVWANPEALPYKRMVHVCGKPVSWLLEYVDYLNFDLKNVDLLSGQNEKIHAFMDRGGILVPGVVYTDPGDLDKLAMSFNKSESVVPFAILHYQDEFLADSEKRLRELIIFLHDEIGLSADEIRDHIRVSPQCGLGGLLVYIKPHASWDSERKQSFRKERLEMAEQLTRVIYDHTQRLSAVVIAYAEE